LWDWGVYQIPRPAGGLEDEDVFTEDKVKG
jgi:hypothetical protein